MVNRTNVYNYVSGFHFLASVLGSAIGSLLLNNHVYILNGLSIFCFLFTAFVAAILVPTHCGRQKALEEVVEPSSESSPSDPLLPANASRNVRPVHISKVPYPIEPFYFPLP